MNFACRTRRGHRRVCPSVTFDNINALRYVVSMIQSFACKETEKVYHREFSKKLPEQIQQVALRKLRMIDAAVNLTDLKVPPNNRLEALQKNRKGQHSIRINQQWRICFIWRGGNAHEVEIVDYH